MEISTLLSIQNNAENIERCENFRYRQESIMVSELACGNNEAFKL